MRKLHGIGLGPGEPELVTLKGRRLLDEASVIFTPTGAIASRSRAADILTGLGVDPARLEPMVFPMSTEDSVREEAWRSNADHIATSLPEGAAAAFVTLGDASVYSTWTYLVRALQMRAPDIHTQTVPGVTTMSAAAATLGIPLVIGDERIALVPTPDQIDDLVPLIESVDTLVLYKVGKRLEKVVAFLEEHGLADCSYFAANVGVAEELVQPGFPEPGDRKGPYMSSIIIRTGDAT